ncbi:MAG: 3'-5' exonuclease [Ignavibacteria bacterium]|nr:3'-5' exonuclease [Ignavibacteria bacterium]
MLNEVKKLSRVLFLDVETVPQKPSYKDLDENWQGLWAKKMRGAIEREEVEPGDIYDRAGIYAEFGKIVCISVGIFENDEATSFRMKSFYGDDEVRILSDFSEMLNSSSVISLCAHNGKEFDFPYIARRCLINGLNIPELLDNAGKKPWEVSNFDTMELWKFGDYKSFTSLNLLAASFGIRSPKDDIDGSDVWRVYWEENDVERIMIYCQKDVVTVARLFLKFMHPGKNFDFDIHYIEQ